MLLYVFLYYFLFGARYFLERFNICLSNQGVILFCWVYPLHISVISFALQTGGIEGGGAFMLSLYKYSFILFLYGVPYGLNFTMLSSHYHCHHNHLPHRPGY